MLYSKRPGASRYRVGLRKAGQVSAPFYCFMACEATDARWSIVRCPCTHQATAYFSSIYHPTARVPGDRITFGYREAAGVRASLRYLSENAGGERTAVVGVSLGAAAFLLADVATLPSAVVLESMYPTIEEALRDRLRLRAGSVGASFAPLLLTQIPMRLGISADHLRPIDHLGRLRAPLLVAAGTEDRRTTVDETRRIFETANAPKELWLVEGAGHVDLYDFNPREYEQRVFGFLGKYLR